MKGIPSQTKARPPNAFRFRFSTPVFRISNEKYVHESAGGAANADVASLASAGISLPVATTAVPVVDGTPPPPVDARADRAFRRFARHVNLRACPRCSAPIEKNGGCPQMCCYACRFQFRWYAARNSSQSGANL